MRAQSRQTSTPSVDWTECSSRASPSREVSPAACEGEFAYALPGPDADVPMDMPYADASVPSFEWAQQPVQQTYAYPEGGSGRAKLQREAGLMARISASDVSSAGARSVRTKLLRV